MNELEKSPVKNGCNGGCCECFTLPFTIEQLTELKKRNNLSNKDKEDLPKVLEMLIPLGQTDTDPQTKIKFNNQNVKPEAIEKNWVRRADGTIVANIYTCKHFDTEKRICNNYENRPHMCKRFGSTCQYEGCCYREKYFGDMILPSGDASDLMKEK